MRRRDLALGLARYLGGGLLLRASAAPLAVDEISSRIYVDQGVDEAANPTSDDACCCDREDDDDAHSHAHFAILHFVSG